MCDIIDFEQAKKGRQISERGELPETVDVDFTLELNHASEALHQIAELLDKAAETAADAESWDDEIRFDQAAISVYQAIIELA